MNPQRIVVKVGTSTLTDARGRIDRSFIADLTAQLATLRQRGCDVVLVSSGAIRAGREALSMRRIRLTEAGEPEHRQDFLLPDTLPYKQAAAAVGQGLLMHTYIEAFAWRGVECAQALLVRDDLDDRRRYLNARNTLQALLSLGVIPVINENDTVAVDEIKFGDNDALAAQVATLIEADLLLILSDVEGLYAHPPENGAPPPPIIPVVESIDADLINRAGASTSGVGTGGMRTKIEAARIATAAGICTIIARGRRERVVIDVAEGAACGTVFAPKTDGLSARKRWMAHSARPKGTLKVNSGARTKILEEGVSLLAVGIVDSQGEYTSGDLVAIQDESGATFARGLTNYAAAETIRILGLRSDQIEKALGYQGFEEVVHRDNLVVLQGTRSVTC